MNQLRDTQTKNQNFVLTNMWERFREDVHQFGKDMLKTEKLFQLSLPKYLTFHVLMNKWTNGQTPKKNLKFNSNQLIRCVMRKMSTNLVKDILKTDQINTHFHLSVKKWTNWRTHKQKILISFRSFCEIGPGEDVHQL